MLTNHRPPRCTAQCHASRRVACAAVKSSARRLQTYQLDHAHVRKGPCKHVELQPDGSDAWKLDAVAEMIRDGAIGIIPTDSYPALVCDLETPRAASMLAALKEVSPLKPMSILARNFSDVDMYTLGWPAPSMAGLPDIFKVVRKLLPGPYTFILNASKMMPKVTMSNTKHKKKQRHTVGVRMPADVICQHLLSLLERPLLCTSVHVDEEDGMEVPDAATMMDRYPGIDFVVDPGYSMASPSTVVDMTGSVPEVLRVGKGSAEPFDPYHIL